MATSQRAALDDRTYEAITLVGITDRMGCNLAVIAPLCGSNRSRRGWVPVEANSLEDSAMDPATELSQRLKLYAATLTAASQNQADDYSIEQWLGFWDEDDSTFGNLRNIEHWLSQASRQRKAS